MARQSDLSKSFDNETASSIVRLDHFLHFFDAIPQCFQSCDLAHNRRTHYGILMNLKRRRYELAVAAYVSHSPAGHRERFGKTAHQQRPILHVRQRSEADMASLISKLSIHFIGNDE